MQTTCHPDAMYAKPKAICLPMQTAGMAAFNENMHKIVEDTKALQAEHKRTKVQLKKFEKDIEEMQLAVAEATATKEVRIYPQDTAQ